MRDEGFKQGGDLLLLTAGQLRGRFKKARRILPVGPEPRLLLVLPWSSLPSSSITGTLRALAQLRTTSSAGLMARRS